MKLITAIIQPHRFDNVKQELCRIGITGMTVSEVRGSGRQKGHREIFRGGEYTVEFIPKIKIEIVLSEERCTECIETLVDAAHSGRIGDGKVFVTNVDDVIRIRTRERGDDAV